MCILKWVLIIATAVQGLIQDAPSLNGPVMMVPDTPGSKNRTSQFQHPGLWHSHDQLELMREKVIQGAEPWKSTYKRFAEDPYSNATYQMQGPHPVISRGKVSNYTSFHNDARAAYQNAIMWYITRDQSHWDRSTSILDAWGSSLENIIGTDRSLLIGIEGSIFANAAEIMRWEGGWVEVGASYKGGSGLSIQLYWLFARQSIVIGQANYGMASIMGLINFSVYLDDTALYNYALYAYKHDRCAGMPYNYLPETGQNSEAGRDQTHVQDALQWATLASRVVTNQQYDLFALNEHLLFTGGEYTGKYLLNETVPYDESFYRCEAVLVDGPWDNISAINRYVGYKDGSTNPAAWGLLYYEALSRGIDVPWILKVKKVYDASVKDQVSPVDPFSWANLLFAVS